MTRIILLAVAVFAITLALLRINDGGAPTGGNASVTPATQPEQQAGTHASQPQQSTAFAPKVDIARGPDSHFRTMVKVNGTEIEMLVDSGATTVALSRRDAERAGIFTGGSNDFSASARTAGGTVRVKPVKLSRVAVGGIERRDVDAAILEADIGVSLLGQSYLGTIEQVSIKGDVMTLQ